VDAAQTASNEATASYQSQLNNGNSSGPYGSVTNSYNPTANQWTQTTSLSPQEQAIFNAGTGDTAEALGIAGNQLGNVQNALDQTLSAPKMQTGVSNGPIQTGYNAGGPIQTSVGNSNINQSVGNAEMANFAGQMQLLQPQMQQASEQQNANLIAQGLNPNDAAYQNSQTLFNNGQAVQLGQAASNAVAAGNAEQNTLFGQEVQQGTFANAAQAQENTQNQGQATFANTAQEQANAEAMANAQLNNSALQSDFSNQAYAQQLPINEFTALASSGQTQLPSAANLSSSAVSPTDVLGAYSLQNQAQQADYQSQMQQYQSGLGGLFSLGSAVMGAL
jgi:hypothetical protein